MDPEPEPVDNSLEDFTPPGRQSNQQQVEDLDREISSTRDELKAKLNEETQPEEKPEDQAPAPPAPEGPDNRSPEERARDERGRFVAKPEAPPAEGEQPPAGEQPAPEETPYAKATKGEKDAARLARVVEQRQHEAEQLARERDEWRAEAERRAQAPRDQGGEVTRFNSDQFARAADEFAKEGFKALENDDAEAALQSFTWARKAQASAQQALNAEQEQTVAQEQDQFVRTWASTVQDVIEEAKTQGIDLNDENNEDAKAIVDILENEPILNYLPDGFRKTWELHLLRKTYLEAPQLRKRIEELEQELSKFTKVRTPSVGSRSRPSGPKKFEDMDMSEQREYLKKKQYE